MAFVDQGLHRRHQIEQSQVVADVLARLADTLADLRVGERVLEQIRERKGEAVAEKARRSLYGG